MGAPSHIPQKLIVDFDIYHPPKIDDEIFLSYKKLHDGPDIVWTPHNGGHWIATRASDISVILSDHNRFSSRSVFLPINMKRPRIIPMELDPPLHRSYRSLLDRIFEPAAVEKWETEIRFLAITRIESFLNDGKCEFISDFAQKLPINFFLNMCGVLEDREALLHWVSASVRPQRVDEVGPEVEAMMGYIGNLIKKRRSHSGEDIMSKSLDMEMADGRKLNDEEALTFFWSLLGGSLDTVTASLGWAAFFLAKNPEHVRQLREKPECIETAVDELFRRFSVANASRVVKNDFQFKEVWMKAGEAVLSPGCLHGLDERAFEDPLKVDFFRKNAAQNMTFSVGIHACPARNLARREMKVFLQEWVKRIPEFEIQGPVETRPGIVPAVVKLPLVWKVK